MFPVSSFLWVNGAGWSADSGLAVYADVAKVPAYAQRQLTYQDICQPHWLFSEPELFWGFWGQCALSSFLYLFLYLFLYMMLFRISLECVSTRGFNDYRLTDPHQGYEIVQHWVEKLFRHTDVAKRLRQMTREKQEESWAHGINVIDLDLIDLTLF